MKIKILFVGPFPIGMASTYRLLSYSIGLAKANNDVEVLLLRPTEDSLNVKNDKIHGIYKGVKFKYIVTNIRPKSIFLKIWYVILGIIRTFFIVKKNDVVILHAADKSSIFFALILNISKKIKLVWIRDEKPVILKKMLWRYLINSIFSGFIFMTFEIKKYATPYLKKDKKIFILPITIDFDRFEVSCKEKVIFDNYFCYVGLNNLKRDGFETLVKSFLFYKNKFKLNDLLLCIGNNNNLELNNYLKSYRNDPNFNSIIFTGKKSGDELISYIKNAKALITTPNIIDSLGFPSKLAEYLASGKPVITTSAGEIPLYLNSDSAFLCEPENIDEISRAMFQVSDNPSYAKEVGLNGYNTAKKTFNIESYIEDILEFLKN